MCHDGTVVMILSHAQRQCLMSNVPDVIPWVHLYMSTVVYRKYIYASLTSLLHLTVHVHCTGPLELGLKLQRSNLFSWSPSHQRVKSIAIRVVSNRAYCNRIASLWGINLGPRKDMYNGHAPSNVKGTLNWQNVNKFIFCTPR